MKMKGDTVVFTLLLLAYGQHSQAVKTKSESANLPAQALNNEDQEVNSPKVTHETVSPRDRGQEEEVCGTSESQPSVQEGECQVNGNDTVDLAQQFKGLRMDDHAEQSTKETEGGGVEAGGHVSVSDLIDEIRDMTIPPDQEDSEMAQGTKETEGGGVEAGGHVSVSDLIDEIRDMTIPPDQEDSEMAQDSFQRHKINGDGNCFFSAVVDQLNHLDLPQRYIHNRKVDHFDLRGMACTYLSNLPEDAKKELSESLEGDADLLTRFQTYINNMRENGEYADHIIIQALADRLLLQIDIYRNDNYEKPVTIKPRSQQGPWPRINLHFTQHSRQDSPLDHYVSLHLTDVDRQTSESSQTNQNLNHESRMGFSSTVLDYSTDQLSNTDQPFRTDQPLHCNIRNRKQPMQNKNQDVHADQSPPSYPMKETRTESAVNSNRNTPMKLKSVKFEQPVVMRRNSDMLSDSKLPTQVAQNSDSKSDSAATTHADTKSYFKIDSVKRGTDFMNHKTQDDTKRVKNSGKVLPPRDIDSQEVLPQRRRDSTKVLPPTRRDKVDGVSLEEDLEDEEDLKHEEDLEDISIKAKSSNALPSYHRLLSHYKDVKKLSAEDFVAVLRDRDCPIHIAILRRRLFNFFEYFHHLLISEVFSDTVGRLCIRVFQSGILTVREMCNSTYIASVHESEYVLLENGSIPNNTLRNFTFDQGVFLIEDFTPLENENLREVRQRISECQLKLPYCPSLFNCEIFVLYVLTGRDDIKSQIDIMNFAEIGLGHFFDYSIPWNIYELSVIFIIIIMASNLFPVSLYDLLSSFIFVPLSKLCSHTKLEKILPSDRFNCNILRHVLVMLMTYFYFLNTCVYASLLYVIPFYFSIAFFSALAGISLDFLRNFLGIDNILSYVFQGFCKICKKFSSGVSCMKKTIVNKMEKKIEKLQESDYFVATRILIMILLTIQLFFDSKDKSNKRE